MPQDRQAFQKSLTYLGLNYSEADMDLLQKVAVKCMVTKGVKVGAAGALVGAVVVGAPTAGSAAAPGWLIGGLIGFTAGTVTCINRNYPWKEALDELLVRLKAPYDWESRFTELD